jgi:hypothetical protein
VNGPKGLWGVILQADEDVLRALGIVLGGRPGPGSSLAAHVDRRLLKTAFRRRAHELHPDKSRCVGLPEAALTHRFHELKGAYDFLLSVLANRSGVGGDLAAPATPNAPRAERPVARATSPEPSPTAPRCVPTIPGHRLRFAQYLYHAGVIDWHTLLAAMRWQYRTRPRVGELARQMSLLSRHDVCEILRQRELDERFGETALRLRRLDWSHLFSVLRRQQRLDRPIGRFFVGHDILTGGELATLLDRQWEHNLACAAAERRARLRAARAAGGKPEPGWGIRPAAWSGRPAREGHARP